MSRITRYILLVVNPVLAVLLAWLGIKTLPSNPIGWFLVLVGVAYTLGVVIVYYIRRDRFWDPHINGITTHEERGDRSLWFVTLGMIAVFYLSPVEYIFLPTNLPHDNWMAYAGLILVIVGTVLFVWARRELGKNYSGHLSVKTEQALVQSGPYRLIRHPAYAGYFLMALGISLGYASIFGLASVLGLLLIFSNRIRLEEQLLIAHFGEAYRQYAVRTKRFIPWVW